MIEKANGARPAGCAGNKFATRVLWYLGTYLGTEYCRTGQAAGSMKMPTGKKHGRCPVGRPGGPGRPGERDPRGLQLMKPATLFPPHTTQHAPRTTPRKHNTSPAADVPEGGPTSTQASQLPSSLCTAQNAIMTRLSVYGGALAIFIAGTCLNTCFETRLQSPLSYREDQPTPRAMSSSSTRRLGLNNCLPPPGRAAHRGIPPPTGHNG